jgi:hypothetical protein
MDKAADLIDNDPNHEKFWIQLGAVLTVMWLPAFLPQFFTWDFRAAFIGFFAAFGGVFGGLIWVAEGAVFKSRKVFLLGLIIGLLSVLVLSEAFEWTKVRITFLLNRTYYQKQVDMILKSKNPAQVETDDDIIVDTSGGGLRIAFDLGAGFIDDFKSIVYDPKGDIVNAPPGLNDNAPFGGDYSRVQRITGHWYFVYLSPDAQPEPNPD